MTPTIPLTHLRVFLTIASPANPLVNPLNYHPQATVWLTNAGLIEATPSDADAAGLNPPRPEYWITPRGEAYLAILLSLPLPVPRQPSWTLPDLKELIAAFQT